MSACCSALRVEQCLEWQGRAHRLRVQLEADQARQAKGAVLVEATSHEQVMRIAPEESGICPDQTGL